MKTTYAVSKVSASPHKGRGTYVDIEEANPKHQAGEQQTSDWQAGGRQAGDVSQIDSNCDYGRVRLS
jgi:hypothetical protein